MQINKNLDGSGSIHKITGNFKGKVSAYYGAGGKLVDAEIIRFINVSPRPVKIGGPIWKLCESHGRVYLSN